MLKFFIDDHGDFRCWNCCGKVEPFTDEDSTVIRFECEGCGMMVGLEREK
jgi:hypothetical protein